MNIGFLSRIPWFSLVLLWLTYTLVGWYLSAHHIVWLVGIFIVSVALYVASRGNSLLERLISFSSQGLFAVLLVSLIISTSIALAVAWSRLLTLLFIPLITTVLAEIEMLFAGFSKIDTFLVLTVFAALGLVVGEIIDVVFLPSNKY
ncbi:MAG: hypothetical protein HC862_25580 [Scytonema sp. RU_4_4]|nr:hypothetical protein [Scytonema sp. RU_4_4]